MVASAGMTLVFFNKKNIHKYVLIEIINEILYWLAGRPDYIFDYALNLPNRMI